MEREENSGYKFELELIYGDYSSLQVNVNLLLDFCSVNKIKLACMSWGWMIAKWICDETTKLGQYWVRLS